MAATAIIFRGSRTFWDAKCELDIAIALHPANNCLEVVCYEVSTGVEYPRVYLSFAACKAKVRLNDFKKLVQTKKDEYSLSQRKVSSQQIENEAWREVVSHLLLNSLDVSPRGVGTFSITLFGKILGTSEQSSIFCVIPSDLQVVSIQRDRQVTINDVNCSMNGLKMSQQRKQLDDQFLKAVAVTALQEKLLKAQQSFRPQGTYHEDRRRFRWRRMFQRVVNMVWTEKVVQRIMESSISGWFERLGSKSSASKIARLRAILTILALSRGSQSRDSNSGTRSSSPKDLLHVAKFVNRARDRVKGGPIKPASDIENAWTPLTRRHRPSLDVPSLLYRSDYRSRDLECGGRSSIGVNGGGHMHSGNRRAVTPTAREMRGFYQGGSQPLQRAGAGNHEADCSRPMTNAKANSLVCPVVRNVVAPYQFLLQRQRSRDDEEVDFLYQRVHELPAGCGAGKQGGGDSSLAALNTSNTSPSAMSTLAPPSSSQSHLPPLSPKSPAAENRGITSCRLPAPTTSSEINASMLRYPVSPRRAVNSHFFIQEENRKVRSLSTSPSLPASLCDSHGSSHAALASAAITTTPATAHSVNGGYGTTVAVATISTMEATDSFLNSSHSPSPRSQRQSFLYSSYEEQQLGPLTYHTSTVKRGQQNGTSHPHSPSHSTTNCAFSLPPATALPNASSPYHSSPTRGIAHSSSSHHTAPGSRVSTTTAGPPSLNSSFSTHISHLEQNVPRHIFVTCPQYRSLTAASTPQSSTSAGTGGNALHRAGNYNRVHIQ